jgi:hypothetical protein
VRSSGVWSSSGTKKDALSIGEILRGLVLIWEIYDSQELLNHLEYLTAT